MAAVHLTTGAMPFSCTPPERKLLLFDGPGGAMGIGFFVLASGLFFRAYARTKQNIPPPFLVVFLRFSVVISHFWG